MRYKCTCAWPPPRCSPACTAWRCVWSAVGSAPILGSRMFRLLPTKRGEECVCVVHVCVCVCVCVCACACVCVCKYLEELELHVFLSLCLLIVLDQGSCMVQLTPELSQESRMLITKISMLSTYQQCINLLHLNITTEKRRMI